MITIEREISYNLYGITNGCAVCGEREVERNDIKEIIAKPKGQRETHLILCRNCRKALYKKLSEELDMIK